MPSHAHVPGCARLNVARLNAFRLNFYEPLTFALIGGVQRLHQVRIAGAAVEHVLNDAPDTASVRVHGFTPVAGQPFALYVGDVSNEQQLFGGRILETTSVYELKPENLAYDLRAIDPTWLLNRTRVLTAYANQSATAIAIDLVTWFARGVTTAHVVAGLPIIDAITFTNETVASCLTAVCERIGAYWYLDYAGDLHVFFSELPDAHVITDAEPRGASDFQLSEDLSQVVTRVIARGGGGSAAVETPPGSTELPVTEDAWYSDGGGIVEVAAQRIPYGGVKGRGGVGALVGTATTPTSPLTVTGSSGTGLGSGTYQYAQTFANATGETIPGPRTTVLTGATAPNVLSVAARSRFTQGTSPQSGMVPGGRYSWRIALLYPGGAYALGPPTPTYTVDQYPWELNVGVKTRDPVTGFDYLPNLTSSGFAQILQVQIYRTVNNGSEWRHERAYADVPFTPSGWLETANGFDDTALSTQVIYPTGPIAQFNAAVIKQPMPVPLAGFTSAHVYRTAVNGSQLKRLVTGINTSVNHVDTAADATLGADAPAADTSGVVLEGNLTVPAGSTALLLTSTIPFETDGGATGGWAQVGNLVIRYTGIGGSSLTGIPAAGIGSLTATVKYGSQVLVQPRLTGIQNAGLGQILRTIQPGDPVLIRVEREDGPARDALAIRLGGVTEDGIVEEVFSDSRMTLVELINYATALLLERKDPRRTLRFVTRDETVQVGRLVSLNISSPPIDAAFRVQKISFDEIAITGGMARTKPRRTVEASTKLYTFADLLRRLRGREGGAG